MRTGTLAGRRPRREPGSGVPRVRRAAPSPLRAALRGADRQSGGGRADVGSAGAARLRAGGPGRGGRPGRGADASRRGVRAAVAVGGRTGGPDRASDAAVRHAPGPRRRDRVDAAGHGGLAGVRADVPPQRLHGVLHAHEPGDRAVVGGAGGRRSRLRPLERDDGTARHRRAGRRRRAGGMGRRACAVLVRRGDVRAGWGVGPYSPQPARERGPSRTGRSVAGRAGRHGSAVEGSSGPLRAVDGARGGDRRSAGPDRHRRAGEGRPRPR